MEYVWFPLFVASVLAFVGFRQWLRHQQRGMVHRERLAALEKGADLPPWPDEIAVAVRFRRWTASLLLSGLIWLAIGLGGMFAAFVIVGHPQVQRIPEAVPPSIALIGVTGRLGRRGPLIVYGVRRRNSH